MDQNATITENDDLTRKDSSITSKIQTMLTIKWQNIFFSLSVVITNYIQSNVN